MHPWERNQPPELLLLVDKHPICVCVCVNVKPFVEPQKELYNVKRHCIEADNSPLQAAYWIFPKLTYCWHEHPSMESQS